MIAPLLAIPTLSRFRIAQRMETPQEVALQMVLRTLDRVGTEYDPVVRVHGAEPFAVARDAGRGLLMIGPHAALSKLVVRYLCDQEYSPVIVVAGLMRFGGMRHPPRQILTSPSFLLHVRTELRAGSIVGAMADHEPDTVRRAFEVQTPAGPVLLSDGLLRIAQKCGSAILFIASALSDDGVVHIYLEPPLPSSQSVEAIVNDFAAFVHSHVERVQQAIRNDTAPAVLFDSEHLRLKPNKNDGR
jgi:lauroyl/myristoyl acyltransferase